jgi:hypothetical protein
VIKRRDSFRNQNGEVVAVVEKSTLNSKRRGTEGCLG